MAKKAKTKKRPGVLVRMASEDLATLNRVCAEECTPRENWIRRLVLAELMKARGHGEKIAKAKKVRRLKGRDPS